jgi:hypothetical protein
MRMNDYATTKYISLSDVAESPIRGVIAEIVEGDFDKPVITFEDGRKLSLNRTAVRTLIEAFGSDDSSTWIGREIEVYQDSITVKGKEVPAIRVRVVGIAAAAARPAATMPRPATAKASDMDDAIPF